MTRRVVEKLCAKKVCVDFLVPILGAELLSVSNSWPAIVGFVRFAIRDSALLKEASEGSRSYQSSVTPLFRDTKAPKTLVLLCFGAIREGRMICDRYLLTS